MRKFLVSTALLACAMVTACSSNNIPKNQDAFLSYKYGTNCGPYTSNSCDIDDATTANLYYQSTGIANPNANGWQTFLANCPPADGADGTCTLDPSTYTLSNWLSNTGYPAISNAHATYANLADLQIGRDMYCSQVGQKVVCYVNNYGPAPIIGEWAWDPSTNEYSSLYGWQADGSWPNITKALTTAVQREASFGTVAMVYDPSKNPNQVSFYAFSSEGTLLADPPLDQEGPKNVPRMCMACHGGTYNVATNSVTGSSFLPFDPFNFRYPKNSSSLTFDAQQESIRQLNALVLTTNPNQPIIDLINGMYPNGATSTGSTPVDGYVPPGWSDNPTLYTGVVRPYCRTCHLAQTLSFTSSSDFEGEPGTIENIICGSHDMPHSQVPFGLGSSTNSTTVGFWNDPVAQRDLGNFFKSEGVASCLPTD